MTWTFFFSLPGKLHQAALTEPPYCYDDQIQLEPEIFLILLSDMYFHISAASSHNPFVSNTFESST